MHGLRKLILVEQQDFWLLVFQLAQKDTSEQGKRLLATNKISGNGTNRQIYGLRKLILAEAIEVALVAFQLLTTDILEQEQMHQLAIGIFGAMIRHLMFGRADRILPDLQDTV